jgi:predicted nuclease of restriction endonuclease-like (RecB) superfamily
MTDLQPDSALFERVVSILEQARAQVVRSVNTSMVTAYWLIGREIVQAIQGGEERAEYGQQVIVGLSRQLQNRFKNGFSVTNVRYFRQFYQTYPDRFSIHHLPGGESQSSPNSAEKNHPTGGEFGPLSNLSPAGRESGFHPQLGWSHYRAIMRVDDAAARAFYEQEAVECGWNKDQLERQIHTAYYQRILANQGPGGLLAANRDRLPGEPIPASQLLKAPVILEFLELPDSIQLHESGLEQAIIENLQAFLLELGKGFSFVARQKHIRFEDDDFYVDLVFYNYLLRCFLLIDLKIGKLNHRDIGQMDGYVRLFEDRFKIAGDNPTIGLILCSDKSEAVAKYSVLSEGRQIFASKYLQFLPSEQELMLEIAKERKQIEAALTEKSGDADA